MRVLNPYIGVIGSEGYLRDRVLYENRGMRLAVAVHYLALIVHAVLYGQCRRDHLAAGAVVIELAAGKGKDGHREIGQLGVGLRGVDAQRASELGIQVILLELPFGVARALAQLHCLVAQ